MSAAKVEPEGHAEVRCAVPIAESEWPGAVENFPPDTLAELEAMVMESATKAASMEGRVLNGVPVCVGLAERDAAEKYPVDLTAGCLVLLLWKCDTVPARA